MKLLLFIGVAVFACCSFAYADNLNKLKLIKAKVLRLSAEYFDVHHYKAVATNVNQTYSRLDIDFTVKKTLPMDTQLVVVVFRSKLRYRIYKKLHEYTIPICTKSSSEYEKYLPDILLQLQQAGKCIPKGQYKIDGVEYFKFYDLLSEQELKNARFKTIISLKSGANYIYSLQLESVSNKR